MVLKKRNLKMIKKFLEIKQILKKKITKLEKKIKKLVEELDFEQAIVLRDEMLKLKELLLEF